jgi:hypothetical protein
MKNWIAFAMTLALAAGPAAFAEHHDGKGMTPEQRAKMAEHHQKMADCLKSDKPMDECHKEMKADCEAMGEACPHHGHGKKKGHDKKAKGKPGDQAQAPSQ